MKVLLAFVSSVLLLVSVNTSAEIIILQCTGTGVTGDLADSRGIRFTVDQPFDAVEVRMDGRVAGSYTFDAELRRSTGFVGAPDFVATGVIANLTGDSGSQPYPVVKIGFGEVPVSGSETFTLKFTNVTGPGSLFFETYGIGNEPCLNVEETEGNTAAVPVVRGDPAGFKVLSGAALEITSSFDTNPPDIDGSIGWGEWDLSNTIPLEHGYITVVNDRQRLYVLVNLLEDDGNDISPPDFFWLTFDVDKDSSITPNVDLNYATHPVNGNMRYQFYLGPGSWTGLQPETFSSQGKGFGCFFADTSLRLNLFPFGLDCNNHRVWEFGIDLAEIGAVAGETVQMGLRVSSPTPAFTDDTPPEFFKDFSDLIRVNLASPTDFIPAPSLLTSVVLDSSPLEVTQAIQTRTNTLPLVDDKATVARVYVDATGRFAVPQASVVSLYASKSGVDLPGSPIAQLHIAPTAIDREDINDTANFRLPATWNDGAIDFRVVARKFGSSGQDDSGTIPLAFTGKEQPTYWTIPINTGTAASPNLPSNAEIASQESYLETVYPVPDVNFVRKPWQAIGSTTVGGTIADLNQYHSQVVLSWILGLLFTGNPPFDLPAQIYGFTPSGGGLSDPVWDGSTGFVARGFRGTSREATMAHEINHNLDKDAGGTWGRHTPFGCGATGPDPSWPFGNDDIQDVGFDTRLPWLDGTGIQDTVIPSDFPDYMSYCQSDDLPGNPAGQLPTKWISTYRWQNLFNNFNSALSVASLRQEKLASMLLKVNDAVMYISGQVNIDGSGMLNPVVTQPGIPVENIKPGEYALEFFDIKGELIQRVPFFVSFVDVEGQKREVVPFNFMLPSPGAPVGLILLKLGKQTLDEIKVSGNPPFVTVLSPNGGEKWTGMQKIQWSARDPDLDPLMFNILYTPDNGQSWVPVANSVRDTTYTADFSQLPGGDGARIRVIVTDGFNTAEDDSDEVFAVLPGPPEVFINAPDSGMIVEVGESIHFSGQASDAEDEFIPDSSYIWSFGKTAFASGKSADAVLPAGNHLVLLSVVDSDGQVGEASIEVTVSPDTDKDGVLDALDNCTLVHNPGQRDTNKDGFGNICDPDLNDDLKIDFADLALMKKVFFTSDPDADLDGDGKVDFADLAIQKQMFFGPPGPSGMLK